MSPVGGTGSLGLRLMAGAAALLATGVTGCTLFGGEQVLSPGDRAANYMVDKTTGEIWACATGGCQLND